MARRIKKTGLGVDSSIKDAEKRAKTRRKQLEAAGGMTHNRIDDLNDELDKEGMSDYEKEVFED
jgi:predicted  nucleic acid-binding Zn-ribbon protein